MTKKQKGVADAMIEADMWLKETTHYDAVQRQLRRK